MDASKGHLLWRGVDGALVVGPTMLGKTWGTNTPQKLSDLRQHYQHCQNYIKSYSKILHCITKHIKVKRLSLLKLCPERCPEFPLVPCHD